jgi:hypothetical protein
MPEKKEVVKAAAPVVKKAKGLTKDEKIAIIEGALRWIGHDPCPREVKAQLELLLADVKK